LYMKELVWGKRGEPYDTVLSSIGKRLRRYSFSYFFVWARQGPSRILYSSVVDTPSACSHAATSVLQINVVRKPRHIDCSSRKRVKIINGNTWHDIFCFLLEFIARKSFSFAIATCRNGGRGWNDFASLQVHASRATKARTGPGDRKR